MTIKNKIDYKYRIGMRTLKTALAVVIGLYISYLLDLDSAIFVSIAAVSTMKPSMSESLEDFKKRLFTCVFGVMVGYFFSKISVVEYLEPLIAGLGILLTIYILVVVKMKDMTQLSCIVFVASFCSNSDKFYYATNRIIGTVIGIIVGVLVNYFISSPNVWEDFILAARSCYRSSNLVLKQILSGEKIDLSEFNRELASATKLYKLLEKEADTPFQYRYKKISREKRIMSLIESISVRLEVVENMNADHFSFEVSQEALKRYDLEEEYSSDLDVEDRVYNYHIEYILKYMDQLKEEIENIKVK
ncbi:MAG: aromatic acid exporter family protein [Peptoniphilus harei]|uniref:Aromatic acid exporter family protein n=1 Tax=Peptoniphilus genitalis TaxID=3036303 RepID=A0ABY4TNZ8_9FIRM|nr:aromatic acid exporter family protein [Peptoniphilus sp. SAHP1]MDU2503187.1 aromatic acid exporter family protein [Peptoniphilus harei]URN42198.1 aromatic acid exporter family protein [Peptoniphilus sp. SAHP1]